MPCLIQRVDLAGQSRNRRVPSLLTLDPSRVKSANFTAIRQPSERVAGGQFITKDHLPESILPIKVMDSVCFTDMFTPDFVL